MQNYVRNVTNGRAEVPPTAAVRSARPASPRPEPRSPRPAAPAGAGSFRISSAAVSRCHGLAATRKVLALPPSRVLILTTFDSGEYVCEAVRAGASGFLL
jgi:hypothetical protein